MKQLMGMICVMMCCTAITINSRTDADELEQQVNMALAQDMKALQGESVYTLCKEKGVVVLPYFNKRISDPNDWVRLDVESAAARFDTPLAFQMLVTLLNDSDPDTADKAADALDRQFPCPRIRQLAEPAFKRNLLARIAHNRYNLTTILLLSCVPYDGKYAPQDVVDALNELLRSDWPPGISQSQITPLPIRMAATNLALARLGQKVASDRLLQTIEHGSVEDVLPLLDDFLLRHITEKTILVPMVELLNDKRETTLPRRNIMADDPRKPIPQLGNLRVCDLALIALSEKANLSKPGDYRILHQRPFTDTELATHYLALKQYFNGASKA